MGTWGTGTFENDTAADFRDRVLDELRRLIDADLDKSDSDGVLERPTLATVACLRAIMAAMLEPVYAREYLARDQAERWRRRYLDWFDKNSPRFGAGESVVSELRTNAEREFDRLLDCLR